MNFITRHFKKQKPGTGQGMIFKDNIKTLAFEVYRGISVLHLAQVEGDKLLYKYHFYTSKEVDDWREDTFHFDTASDLDESKAKAFKAIDKLVD